MFSSGFNFDKLFSTTPKPEAKLKTFLNLFFFIISFKSIESIFFSSSQYEGKLSIDLYFLKAVL